MKSLATYYVLAAMEAQGRAAAEQRRVHPAQPRRSILDRLRELASRMRVQRVSHAA